ncbi:MAG: hypothetical protein JKY92_04125 [Magnetovibrio sp.]|nr:hypothetical protein [Magnetovibrio sp.]
MIDILPTLSIAEQSMMPVRRSTLTRSRGRVAAVEQDAFYYWKCDFVITSMSQNQDRLFHSIMMKIDSEFFLCYDLFHPRPALEDNGQPLANGEGVLSVITDSLNVTVSGVPAGFRLSDGDYIEFRVSDTVRTLNVISQDTTADAGGVVDVVLNYPLDTENFPTASIVNFEKPACIMRRVAPHSRNVRGVIGTGGFSAEEMVP